MDRGKVIIYQTPDGDTQLDVKLKMKLFGLIVSK